MAGPIAGIGQQTALYQAAQQAGAQSNQAQTQLRGAEPREKQIEPQGTRVGLSEESNTNRGSGNAQFDAQQVLAAQEEATRGAVLNLLV